MPRPSGRQLRQWATGPKGGQYYVSAGGEKVYGKEALAAAAAEGAGPPSPAQHVAKSAADPLVRLQRAKSTVSPKVSQRAFKDVKIKDQPAGAHPDAVPAGRKWVDHMPEIAPSGKEGGTMRKHFPDAVFNEKGEPTHIGKPTPERQKLHDSIMAHYVDSVAKPEGRPQAILTMGGPASGKSSMLKKANIPDDRFVRIDADGIKEKLPEYQHMADPHKERGVSARSGAAVAHEESSHLAKQVRDRAMAEGKNLIFDGTGNDAKKYMDFISKLKEKGYHVTIMMTDLHPDEGLKRAEMRAEHTGRYVPPDFISKAYQAIPPNFEKVARSADDFMLYDSHGPAGKGPRPVWTKLGGIEQVHDPEYKAKFDRGEPRG